MSLQAELIGYVARGSLRRGRVHFARASGHQRWFPFKVWFECQASKEVRLE
jgi:hypothetical protein